MADPGDDACLVTTVVDPDENVSMAVLRAIAAVEDAPIEELPQFYRTIDPDALCELLEDDRFQGTVEFDYDRYRVAIDGDREIKIHDGADST